MDGKFLLPPPFLLPFSGKELVPFPYLAEKRRIRFSWGGRGGNLFFFFLEGNFPPTLFPEKRFLFSPPPEMGPISPYFKGKFFFLVGEIFFRL